jgi:hypothetical protein
LPGIKQADPVDAGVRSASKEPLDMIEPGYAALTVIKAAASLAQ